MNEQDELDQLLELRQLLQQRQQLVGQVERSAEEKAFEEAPWYEKAGAGFGTSVLKTAVGLQKLAREKGFPISSEEWQKRDEESLAYRQRQAKGFAGGAGELVGDIAQLAVPGGAAYRGAKAVQGGGKLVRALAASAPLATDIAASGGLNAVRSEEGERGDAFKSGAIDAVIGATLGKVGGKLLGGVSRSKEGQSLIEQGVPLTASQAASGPLPSYLATAAQFVPVIGRMNKAAREKAYDVWDNVALNKAAPEGIKIEKSGAAGINELNEKVSKAYDAAWVDAGRLNNKQRLDFASDVKALYLKFGSVPQIGNQLRNVYEEFGNLTKDYSLENIRRFDSKLGDAVSAMKDDRVVQSELKQLRKIFRDESGGQVSEKLAVLDKDWPKVRSVMQGAGLDTIRKEGGGLTPEALLTGSGRESSIFEKAGLRGPLDKFAIEGQKTVGKGIPGFLPSGSSAGLAKIGYDFDTIGQLIRRLSLGQTIPQRGGSALADALREAGASSAAIYSAQNQ